MSGDVPPVWTDLASTAAGHIRWSLAVFAVRSAPVVSPYAQSLNPGTYAVLK
jgi:hypothetical protein